ncbi:MAG TPA: DUF1489 domain-containing protein [Stellaceae bacterium]|jgi:hypothetical protein|nr:DUF1489 domain-containing protein [Stellaceae bacterium]
MALHLVKMAVGATDFDSLCRGRAERTAQRGWSAVYTRNRPRREEEVLDGGSLFWVIRGQIRARQRIVALHAERDDNGRGYCLIETETEVVPTLLRPFRPFQGWRYLLPADAPPDRTGLGELAGEPPPEAMMRELRDLGLI